MRIFYLLRLNTLDPSTGIVQKITSQHKYFSRSKYNVVFLIVIQKGKDTYNWTEKENVEFIFTNKKIRNNKNTLRLVSNKLDSLDYTHDDIVYSRNVPQSYYALSFVKKYNTVFEHNSKTIAESKSRIIDSIKNLQLHSALITLKQYINLQLYFSSILQFAKGGIAVTNEIATALKTNNKNVSYNCRVIANGCDYENYQSNNHQISDLSVVNMVMLAGSENSWNGIERIIDSVNNHGSSDEFHVYIVGKISHSEKRLIARQSSISYVKPMNKNELAQFLTKIHVGIGTLALYKKDMYEACPLKVREYLALGLPIVIGYIDTDISKNTSLASFVYNVPNTDEPIDFAHISCWAKELYKTKDINSTISQTSYQYVDMSMKINDLSQYLESLISEMP